MPDILPTLYNGDMARERLKAYTHEIRTEAVARVIAGESLRAVAADMGIERSTLRGWYARAQEIGEPLMQERGVDHAAQWGEASSLAAQLIKRQLTRYADDDRDLSPRDLQSVAIVGGISTDKHLDYRDGRTKGGINVDNRQVHLQVSPEQARALLAEAAESTPAAIEAPETP